MLSYPLDLRFKLLALASRISVHDASGQLLCHVKQKMFKLREAITVFADEAQTRPLYQIQADRIIDFSARYRIDDATGRALGVVQRRGMRSLWRAHYEVERDGRAALTIREENPWIEVLDGLFQRIPVLGALSGYVFHPAYVVTRVGSGEAVLRVVKRPALFEGVFRAEALGRMEGEEEQLAIMSVLVMLLLERQRG
jgi:hypothetical protein